MSDWRRERAAGEARGMRQAVVMALVGSLLVGSLPAPAQQRSEGLIKITILQGEGSLNNIKRKMAQAPVVEVKDESGRPVEGASVVFALPFAGPSGKFADGQRTYTAKTDGQGRASAGSFTPNEIEGRLNINVTATAGERKASIVVPQSNTLAGGIGTEAGRSFPRWLLGLGVTGGATTALIVARRGSGGGGSSTPTPSAPVPTTITIGSVSVGGPR